MSVASVQSALMEDENIQKALTETEIIVEYLAKKERVENEIQVLKDDLKELKEQYKDQIDLKTLGKVERIKKIRNSIEHEDTFAMMLEVVLDKAMGASLKAL